MANENETNKILKIGMQLHKQKEWSTLVVSEQLIYIITLGLSTYLFLQFKPNELFKLCLLNGESLSTFLVERVETRGWVDYVLENIIIMFRHLCSYTRNANGKSEKCRKLNPLPMGLQNRKFLSVYVRLHRKKGSSSSE